MKKPQKFQELSSHQIENGSLNKNFRKNIDRFCKQIVKMGGGNLNKAFTLIELLAVIVILAIIAVIATPIILGVIDDSKEEAFKRSVESALNQFDFIRQLEVVTEVDANSDSLKLQHNRFINGNITIEDGKAKANYISDGNYCAIGYLENLQISKGTCNVDNMGPIITIEKIESIDKNSLTIKVNALDYGSGIEGDSYSFDNGVTWQSSNELLITSSYNNIIKVKDKEGNTSSKEYSISKLTINANGGVWNSLNESSIYWLNNGETKEIGNPIKPNYLFNGWTRSGTGSSINGTTFIMGDADTTLTANWILFFTSSDYTYTGTSEFVDDGNGNFRIKFLTSGTLTIKKAISIDVFLVGGGGAGQQPRALNAGGYGGGGGGGFTATLRDFVTESNKTYEINVGSGGTAPKTADTIGGRGGTTSAFGLSAEGGYGGGVTGYYNDGNYGNGGEGGSGGGAAFSNGGSNGSDSTGNIYGKGQRRSTKEFGEPSGTLYAGGGAGAGYLTEVIGGVGGGGNGSYNTLAATSGLANTGGGGGGNSDYTKYPGNGGSGIVVIRNVRTSRINISDSEYYTYTGLYEYIDEGDGNYKIKLLTNGIFTSNFDSSIDVFLVGGGGGGQQPRALNAGGYGGGGGGGFTTTSKNISINANTKYNAIIGMGGIAYATADKIGGRGGTTSAFGLSAEGGYGGGTTGYIGNYGYGGKGGSGGGYALNNGGSNGSNGSGTGYGIGQEKTTKEFEEQDGILYAGGGAGGGYQTAVIGGAGGGGNGSYNTLVATSGLENTGGGGGGNSDYKKYPGDGGSGIVIIRNARNNG